MNELFIVGDGFSYTNQVAKYHIKDGVILQYGYPKDKAIYQSVRQVREDNGSAHYLKLLNTDLNNESDILNFCNNYGRLTNSVTEKVTDYQHEIKVMRAVASTSSALDSKNQEQIVRNVFYLNALENFQKELSNLYGVANFWGVEVCIDVLNANEQGVIFKYPQIDVHTKTVDFNVQDLKGILKTISIEDFEIIETFAAALVTIAVNRRLTEVKPKLGTNSKNEIISYWEPENLLSAMYMEFSFRSSKNKKITECARPGCNRYFESEDRRRKYCDPQPGVTPCGVLVAKKKYREPGHRGEGEKSKVMRKIQEGLTATAR